MMKFTGLPPTFSLLLLFLPFLLPAQPLTIQNHRPRLTTDGAVVDAHDGRTIAFDGRYYWYGTAYGTTNGFTPANHYVAYHSPDLEQWEFAGPLLENAPEGVYYRPHVVFNPATKQYVLWYNWYPKLWEGRFGVAVSDTPTGPFRIVNDNVPVARSSEGVGDLGLFVDEDGTCYLSYNTIQNHRLSVEKLSPDFLRSAGESSGVIAEHVEAGALFRRQGKYYLLTDYTCCFCNEGSGARVYLADHPLGPYEFSSNINRHPGRYSSILNNDDPNFIADYEVMDTVAGEWPAVELVLESSEQVGRIAARRFTGNRPANCGNVDDPRVHPEIGSFGLTVEFYAAGNWQPVTGAKQTTTTSGLQRSETLNFDPVRADRFRLRFRDSTLAGTRLQLTEVDVTTDRTDFDPRSLRVYLTGKGYPRHPIVPAQQGYVSRIETGDGPRFVWMGDLWGSAPDDVKGHDLQVWLPLEFRADGSIRPLQWQKEWTLD